MKQDLEDRDPVGRGRSIILADDSTLQRKLVRVSLVAWGFRVEEASSAREALRMARSSPPAAIVSDFLMPGGDGLTFCSVAKRDEQLARVPFIVVSSILCEGQQKLEGAKEFGVDAFVSSKPRHRALAQALRKLLPPV